MEGPDSSRPPEKRIQVHDPTAVAVGLMMTEMTKTVKPLAREEGETMVLEYGRPFKWFAVILWMLTGGAFVAAALTAEPSQREALAWTIGFFLVLALVLHLEFFHVSIRYDVHGLQTKSPWRRNRVVPWEDITGVTFSKAAQWYVLSTTRYGKVRMHFWLSGIQSMFRELERRGFEIPDADLVYKNW